MNTKSFFYLFAFLGSFLLISSCVKNEFDEPPADGEDPNLVANATIADVLAQHSTGVFKTLEEDWIIQGIVVGDDESGNIYKAIVIEDETGGITISINATGLYNEFTVGRKVFVKCKGLVLTDDRGLIKLGGSSYLDDGSERLAGIEEVLLNEFIFPGLRNQEVTPTVYTIGQLNPSHNSTLIQINDVEFSSNELGVMFANPDGTSGVNMTIRDCNGFSIAVRTSDFCNFASDLTPTGNGTFVGIMSQFNEDAQLIIRNPFDLEMTNVLCDGTPPPPPPTNQCEGEGDGAIDENFSSQSQNADINFPGWCNIATQGERLWIGKEFDGNVYAQASAFGDLSPTQEAWLITETVNVTIPQFLNFESAQNNWTHDGLSVWISSDYDGDPLTANWTELTAATLAVENDSWYEFIPSGDIDLSAFSGDVNIGFKYVGSGPSGQTGGFSIDNVLISEDGLGDGGGGNGGVCEGEGDGEINENFSNQTNNQDVSLDGWCNVATTGARLWRAREFDGNFYVQATAFQDTDPSMVSWLITETIDVTTPKTLNFDAATAFYTHDGLSVWISSDYTGDPLAANWTELNCNLPGSGQANYEFVNSGDIDLSGFSGDVNIAFRYDGGSSAGDTGTFQLDNVVVSQ